MTFDGTVHLGDVIVLLTVLAGVAWQYFRIEAKVNLMYGWFVRNIINGKKGD